MTYKTIFLSVGLVSILVGCSHPVPLAPRFSKTFIPQGYVCTSAPTAAYSPGYIFRRDMDGIEHLARDMSEEVKPLLKDYETVFGEYRTNAVFSVDANATLLAALGEFAETKVGAEFNSEQTTYISFSKSAVWVQMDDTVWNSLKEFISKLPREKNSRYFIVRDSILSRNIKFNFSDEDKVQLFGNVSIDELLKINPSFGYRAGGSYTLEVTASEPLNVCIKTVQVFFSDDSQAGIAGDALNFDLSASEDLLLSK